MYGIVGLGSGTAIVADATPRVGVSFAVRSWRRLSLGFSRRRISDFSTGVAMEDATLWVCLVMLLDFFVVGLLVLHSLDMFGSLLGTWIPFALIFVSSFGVGRLASGRLTTCSALPCVY